MARWSTSAVTDTLINEQIANHSCAFVLSPYHIFNIACQSVH